MTMNMLIVMHMNIYITPENTIKLREYGMSGKSMSGLVNDLLEKHFGGTLAPSKVPTKHVLTERNLSQKYEGKEKTQGLVIHDQNPVAPESGKPTQTIDARVSGAVSTPIITDKNKSMDFCKHGAVKGLCKKGCK